MGREIERRFLLASPAWRALAAPPAALEQFYLVAEPARTVRVRIVDGARAFLTLKAGFGLVRHEFEYEIPLTDARDMEALRIGHVLRKSRHRVPLGAWTIEIDVYEGALAGLEVAEIELASEGDLPVPPDFLGREITGDPRYSNARLAMEGLADGFPGNG